MGQIAAPVGQRQKELAPLSQPQPFVSDTSLPSIPSSILESRLTRKHFLASAATLFVAALAEKATPLFNRNSVAEAAPSEEVLAQALPMNFPIPDGHVYRQTNGQGSNPATNTDPRGFAIRGAMWQKFQELGGVDKWGPPVTRAHIDPNGREQQFLHKGGLQLTKDQRGNVVTTEFTNIFDDLIPELRRREINLDNNTDMVPPYNNWESDGVKRWGHDRNGGLPGTIEENHFDRIFQPVQLISTSAQTPIYPERLAAIQSKILENQDWFNQYGLPMGLKTYNNGAVTVVVTQRAAFQFWNIETPWARKGEVVVVNGGDYAKKYLVDRETAEPELFEYVAPLTPLEQFVNTTQRVDSVEYRDSNTDKVYTVDSRVTPNASYKITIPDEFNQVIGEKVAREGKNTGMNSVTIIVARSANELPEGALPKVIQANLNSPFWYGARVSYREGDKGYIIYIPKDDLNLNDRNITDGAIVNDPIPGFPLQGSEERRFGGVNTITATQFSNLIITGGEDRNGLLGNQEYLHLNQVLRPLRLTRR